MRYLLSLGRDCKSRKVSSWKRMGSISRTLSVVIHYFLIFLTLKYGSLVLNTIQQSFPQLIYIYILKFRTRKKKKNSMMHASQGLNNYGLDTCLH